MKKTIKEVIVVEGRDDISAVKAAVDAEIIQTNGFAIRKKGNIEKLRVAYNRSRFRRRRVKKIYLKVFPRSKTSLYK